MNITDIRVRKVSNAGPLKAYVSITIDDAFTVHDIRVIEKNENRFIAMPSRKVGEGSEARYMDIAHPINKETRESLQAMILEAYDKGEGDPVPDLA